MAKMSRLADFLSLGWDHVRGVFDLEVGDS